MLPAVFSGLILQASRTTIDDVPSSTTGNIGHRNVTMAANIHRWAESAAPSDELVCVVGDAHIAGIKYHLESRAYKPISQ